MPGRVSARCTQLPGVGTELCSAVHVLSAVAPPALLQAAPHTLAQELSPPLQVPPGAAVKFRLPFPQAQAHNAPVEGAGAGASGVQSPLVTPPCAVQAELQVAVQEALIHVPATVPSEWVPSPQSQPQRAACTGTLRLTAKPSPRAARSIPFPTCRKKDRIKNTLGVKYTKRCFF